MVGETLMFNASKLKKNAIEILKLLAFTIIGLTAFFYVAESEAAECQELFYTGFSGADRPYKAYYTDSTYLDDECFNQSSGFVVVNSTEYALLKQLEEQMNDVSIINAEDATIAFTFGMSGYLIFWFVGYKGRMARRAISFM